MRSKVHFDMNTFEKAIKEVTKPEKVTPPIKECDGCFDSIGPWWGVIEVDLDGNAYPRVYCRRCAPEELKNPPKYECDDASTNEPQASLF